ncbi:unnamed protein product [Rotaria magnacalcarata]|uniref:FLYWCH-type domain-containing protein n=3 Tax=Rotaria magnacalcarata TaxID=392030 RepID=A0A816L8G8_9BILA|nr:unnamed protein product [Rotaria magnacalcarata]CAF4441350.1 unnamed protein product [Rotaria magnacalcarata]
MAKATASTTDVNQAKSLAISFINSNKGKPLLLADEYVFKLNKNTTTTKYWIRTLNGCPAKVHTDLNSQFIKIVGDHNHFSEKEQLEVREFREKVKQRAIHETTPIHLFHSRFNRRVQVNHPNIWSFIKFLQGEENRFHHIYIQFTAGLGARPKQAETIAIQRRIDTLDKRYYDGAMNAMEYLGGLSFTVAKRKK